MRAVLISPDPSSNAGGVERFCHTLAGVLERDGWSTELVGPTLRVPAALARAAAGPSIQAVSATRAARRRSADLVISNGFLGGPTSAPRIHVFHGTMVRHVAAGVTGSRRYRLREAIAGSVPEALCGRGATVVAVSGTTASELHRYYRQRVDAVIANGVDTELFSPGDRALARQRLGLDAADRYALFVGRFEHRKGADLVPEACRRAGFRLLVAGSGAPAGATSLGVLAPGPLADAYRAADCVVLPSRYEACSFVVLEALASAVPLITTAVGWMCDLLSRLPGYRRWIIDPDVDQLAGALSELEPDPELISKARTYVVHENSLEAFGRQWLELIREVRER